MQDEDQAGPPPADPNQTTNPPPPVPDKPAAPPVQEPTPTAPTPPAPEPSVPPTPTPAATVDPIASSATPGSIPPGADTSGQGSAAVVPEEVKGWSWGAFFLTWIWGIGNSVWLALLAFVPFVGIVMPFVLGIKGREWAWQAKRWDSVEHFKKTQHTWDLVGIILGVMGVLLFLVWFFIAFTAFTTASRSAGLQ